MKELKKSRTILIIVWLGLGIFFYSCSSKSSTQKDAIESISMGIIGPDEYSVFLEIHNNYDTLDNIAIYGMDELECYNLLEVVSGFKQINTLKIINCSLDRASDISIWESDVKVLVLEDCGLKEVPEFIESFTSLEELDLSSNLLTDKTLNVGNLIGIAELNVSNNKIEVVPQSIFQLVNLRSLDLSDNKISNISDSIKILDNLDYFSIHGNELNGNEVNKLELLLPKTKVINQHIIE